MKTKTIFLLFIFGAVVVLAEKDSTDKTGVSGEEENSEEEIPSTGEEIGFEDNAQSDDAFKSRELFISFGKSPTSPSSTKPKDSSKPMGKGNLLWEHTEKSMKNFNKKGDQIFLMKEKEFTDKKEGFEDLMKLNLNKTQETLKEHQVNETQNASQDGKSTIEKCLKEKMDNFNEEINVQMENTYECFDNATDEAKSILEKSKNAFNETYGKAFEELKRQTDKKSCPDPKKKNQCYKKRLGDAVKTIKKMIGDANSQMRNLTEALKKPEKEMEDCYKDFDRTLKEKKDALVSKCGNTAEVSKLKDGKKEEGKEENGEEEGKEENGEEEGKEENGEEVED